MCKKQKRTFVLVSNNMPVEFGDIMCGIKEEQHSFGSIKIEIEETLLPTNVDKFIKGGVLRETTNDKKPESIITIDDVIERLAKDLDTKVPDLVEWLDKINKKFPVIVFSLMLKVVANKLNTGKSLGDRLYCISNTFKVIEVNKDALVKAPCTTYFFKESDAKFALELLKEQVKWCNGK